MAKVSTYLNFPNQTEEAFKFYQSVFGGEFIGGIARFSDIPPSEGMPPMAEADKNLVMHIVLPILGEHQLMGTDAPKSIVSAKAGFNFALRSEKPDPQSTIDLPVFYSRMAHYYNGSTVRLGAALKGSLGEKWFYEEGIQAFVVTRAENNFFFENTGTIMWALGKSLRIRGGYIVAYGKYPYVTPKWQMWPTLDLVFGSK